MRIGQLAKCTGASVQALRYYEREGVLRKPARTASGYRAYTGADVEHVLFVKRCQKVGFSLQDIKQLSDMHGMTAAPPTTAARKREQFLALARQRVSDLDVRIAALQQLRAQIGALLGIAENVPEGCPAAFVKKS